MGVDAMRRAFHQISSSPFSKYIKDVELPRCFVQLAFVVYNGKIDPMEHASHFNQRMTIHLKNEALMSKVFPSSLDPTAKRWFDGLEEGSIRSYEELTKAYEARFLTCSRVPKPIDSFLTMAIREGEFLRAYFDRYWELFNEIKGNFGGVAAKTFKVGLPMNFNLRKSLTMNPARDMH